MSHTSVLSLIKSINSFKNSCLLEKISSILPIISFLCVEYFKVNNSQSCNEDFSFLDLSILLLKSAIFITFQLFQSIKINTYLKYILYNNKI